MIHLVVAGMALALNPSGPVQHVERVEHRGVALDVTYRANVAIDERQIGTIVTGGRPSTLRCMWTARVDVERHAVRGDASRPVLQRRIASDTPLRGSRMGSCAQNRGAIAKEVAARSEAVRAHLIEVAMDDRAALTADIDDAHATLGNAG